MSAGLRAAARDYLSERRARGYRLQDHEWLLGAFLDGLETRGATRITVAGALAFATARPGTQRAWRSCGSSPGTCTASTRRPPS